MLLISGAVKAGTSKTGKKIITAIASSLAIIVFLLIAFTTNVLSIFLNVGHVDLNNFDAKGTPIYQEIRSMYDDFVEVCKPVKEIRADYPFEVKVAKPFKRPTQSGGTDASVFAVEGVPTFGFNTQDIKGYNFSYGEIWHTERDLYTKNIPEYQEHAATVTAVVALGIANLSKQLSREGMHKK